MVRKPVGFEYNRHSSLSADRMDQPSEEYQYEWMVNSPDYSMKGDSMRSVGIVYALLFACMLSFAQGVMAQDLQVLVLDASNGKPQANVDVEYFCTGLPRNSAHTKVVTNKEGLAKAANLCGEKQKIYISVFPHNRKEQCGVGPITLKQILTVGAVAQPDADGGISCPTKVSKKLKPVPGQIIMFVKKPTWWQSHVAGE